jgi:hypothetical protein
MRVDILIKYFWIPLILSGASFNAQYMISISNIWLSGILKLSAASCGESSS